MVPQVSSVDRPTWVSAMSLPRGLDAALRLFDRYYLLVMIPVSALILFLNYHAQGMQGVLPNYEDFKRIILAGFDPKAGVHGTPTFPMWGYGWLLLVTENKTVLLALQNALALLAVWTFLRSLERSQAVTASTIRLLKLLLAISVPWYAFHSLRWPYSVAMSLFLVSFVLFVDSMSSGEPRTKRLLFSGALFGLVLNFRSDYIWMPWMFVGIALAARGWNRQVLAKGAAWLAVVYLFLLPWALYTRRATGHFLLTSTNAGHVLFIGLGNLPDNKWGITPHDGDPVMRALIRERFTADTSSLSYETDRFLKREFLRRIVGDPSEYARKLLHNFRSMLVTGVYAGEFFERPECQPRCFIEYIRTLRELRSDPATSVLTRSMDDARALLHVYSGNVGKYEVLFSFILFPLVAILAWREKNLLMLLVLGGIAYQAALNVLAYHMATYTSNMYFFHLINLSVGAAWLGGLLVRRRRVSAGKQAYAERTQGKSEGSRSA